MKATRISFTVLLLVCSSANAMSWIDWWQRPDQQGASLLKQKQPAAAAKKFTQPLWQGVAWYRAGDYVAAARAFQQQQSDVGYYNLGNALAQAQQYQDAILAYEQALKRNPQHADAAYNKKLLEAFLKENPPPPEKNPSQQQDKNQKDQPASAAADQKNGQQQVNNGQQKAQDPSAAQRAGDTPQSTASTATQSQQEQPKEGSADAQAAQQQLAPEKMAQGFSQQGKSSNPEGEPENVLEAVPDDPGGLLRQKFLRDYLRKQQEGKR